MKDKIESFQNGYKYKVDRISAYLIDLLIVTFLITFLVSNTITNPFYNKTNSVCSAYSEVEKEAKKDLDYASPESITAYIKKISPTYRTCYIRKSYAGYVWYVILTLFYFGLFAYLNDGQTLGKKMFRLKVVNNKDGKSAKFYQLIIRNIFGGNRLLAGNNLVILISLFLPLIKNGYHFSIGISILAILTYIIDIVFILLFIFKKNGRTLDDLLGFTKVIRVDKKRVSKEN
jgi:uncharacterized RDD family membrane protein YckC